MKSIEKLLQRVANSLGVVLLRTATHEWLVSNLPQARALEIAKVFKPADLELYFQVVAKSKAQLSQDVFAAAAAGLKRGGFFVEFGATNGIDLSNSYVLEKELGWSGILAEPALMWHSDLAANRTAVISQELVWSRTGESLEFLEDAELSTILSARNSDSHSRSGSKYRVDTISLTDLLDKFNAPNHVDFLSIDTEGSEFEILETFDFEKYSFGAICVEHNFTPKRSLIQSLLESKGYVRVLESISQFDDWYVPTSAKTI